ncbi:uncharacterized protein LOC110467184 isoform X2 [Mizuhopecten yessoensis]|uniref:uncharacterized protein LOC110467184 isoform X1 n=1 Tax=Mizuhopecten yessoensis TaxID=6573 RepID=UPI000B4579EC|nr:uncharacterized protein LOC110467184 isoform X1 [Mizuhopecten yessoensis]XP_021379835.1 uncharacterized protein LOC110467184 isoform X2 [Mizuhopecten yessoensis]
MENTSDLNLRDDTSDLNLRDDTSDLNLRDDTSDLNLRDDPIDYEADLGGDSMYFGSDRVDTQDYISNNADNYNSSNTAGYNSDVHQRSGYQDDYDISLEDDDLNDDDYAADAEDNEEMPHKHKVFYDPGHFRYNRKVCVAAIPCLLILFAVCGEMLLVIASFGVALLLSIDHGGQNQRTVVIFMVLFIPCHILVLYSFTPLLWVSLLSMLLMALINAFVLLTGAWMIIQFTIFRKQEAEMCVVTEKLLFSAYPGLSACLLTWAVATIIPLKFIPFVLTAIGFVFLQLFMTPTNSSFKLQPPDVKEDDPIKNIVDHMMLAAIATMYCLLPSFVQIMIGVYQLTATGVFHIWFMVDVVFLLALTMFLTTLMSIRSVIESIGMNYDHVIKVRWMSGAVATILCYPALLNLGISSHFLPWLPAAIALYSSFGALLGYKKYKTAASVCFALVLIFSLVWPAKLPWKLTFNFLFGLPLTSIYILLLVNSCLCLTTAYIATHGRQEVFSILLTLQTFVFIKCELVLFSASLYGWPLFIVTMTAASYTIQRLQVSRRLPQNLACFCMSAHITKGLAILLTVFVHYQELSAINCMTLFCFVVMVTRVFANEIRPDATVKEIMTNLGLLSLSVMANISPLLFILASYLFQGNASGADATGIGFIICGILVIAVCSLHLSGNVKVRQLGIVAIVIGLFILMLQPGAELTWYCAFQWMEMASVLLTAVVIGTDFVRNFYQIAACSLVLGFCPGVRAVIMLYQEEEEIPLIGAAMFVVTSLFITCALLCFFKASHLGYSFEQHMIRLCVVLMVLSQVSLLSDLITKDRKQAILHVPAWKLFLAANLTVSVCLKILSLQKYKAIIPLTTDKDDKKHTSLLPIAGNAATIMSFLLFCLLAPAAGFLHDVWCCGASLVLICLQKDTHFLVNLKEENQTVPTKLTAIVVLLVAAICRTRIWDAYGFTVLRCVVEILLVLAYLPVLYILWGVLWRKVVLLSEQVVVFLMPLNLPLILYGTSYTSWAMATTSVVTCLWMMTNILPLKPYQPPHRSMRH